MNVLLTNDDGIASPSLHALYFALKKAGHDPFVVAPAKQQSGMGRAVTVFGPILTEEVADGDFKGIAIYGTPADCVKLGLGHLAPFETDLVISGINQGPNAGPDLHYSGTVGAAAEAAQANIPAMAISHMRHEDVEEIDDVAAHAIAIADKIPWEQFRGRVMNLNYPACNLQDCVGMKICSHSRVPWPNYYEGRDDPRGRRYWWFASSLSPDKFEADSDRGLLREGFITLTPLKFDYNDDADLAALTDVLNGNA